MATMPISQATELFAAVGHHYRLRILVAMGEEKGSTSPKRIADKLEISLGVVSYHVRVLAKNKLIRETRRQPVRGAVEHFYSITKQGKSVLQIINTGEADGTRHGLRRA